MAWIRLDKLVGSQIKEAKSNYEKGGVDFVGVPSGFYKLDRLTGGYRNGTSNLVCGRPGMGKSAWMMTTALNMARAGNKVAIFSLEMSPELLALRAIAGMAMVEASDIEHGRLDESGMFRVEQSIDEFMKLPIAIEGENMDVNTLADKAKQFKEDHGLDAFFVDYITRLQDDRGSDHETITYTSRRLLDLAIDLHVPGIVLAQLNRQVESREGNVPNLADLRGSGSLEQDAHTVLACMRPHYYAQMHDGEEPVPVEKDARLILLKNRQGEVGSMNAWYHGPRMEWTQDKPVPTKPNPSSDTKVAGPVGPLAQKVRDGAKK